MRVLWIGVVVGWVGCAAPQHKRDIKLTPPSELCADPSLRAGNLCMPTARVERLLKDAPMSVLQAIPTSHGTSGAMTMWLEFPEEHVTLRAKWKQAAHGGSAINNEPRKELAAYEMQKLFLDPDEYVVPPTESRCIALDYYATEIRPTKPTFEGTRCSFGVLAYWLEGMKSLGTLDRTRFEADLKYRATLVNLNVFTYLFDHRDTRDSNFVMTKQPENARAFSIDNGLALSGLANPRSSGRWQWSHMVVPKLPHAKVDRLRAITREQLDKLATVAQFEINGQQLNPVPPTAPFDPKEGVRRKDNVIQLGLTRAEIDDIEGRLKTLLRRIDAHEIEQY